MSFDERRVLVVGGSHTAAFRQALVQSGQSHRIDVVNARALSADNDERLKLYATGLREAYAPDIVFAMIGRNAFYALSVAEQPEPFDVDVPGYPLAPGRQRIPIDVMKARLQQGVASAVSELRALRAQFPDLPMFVLASPPPVAGSEAFLAAADRFPSVLEHGVAPQELRRKLYVLSSEMLREAGEEMGVAWIDPPAEAEDANGFLLPQFASKDVTHANAAYGALLLAKVKEIARDPQPWVIAARPPPASAPRAPQPYRGAPHDRFWRYQPADPAVFDPVTRTGFSIGRNDGVVTAGSCFAQHVARVMRRQKFNVITTERAHPMLGQALAEDYGYGMFAARYGNIYTARQLKQLIQRAYGAFTPADDFWIDVETGHLIDPFRPQIHPGGFATGADYVADREIHFAAIREAFAQMSVFVFTLGLTEAWVSRRDGAAYPVAPGSAGGSYDPEEHAFINFGVDDVEADLLWSLERLRQINPGVRFVVTVSPVPLAATYRDQNVVVATTYSKAVLRVAAERVCERLEDCDYFPSYEIITNPLARGRYFAEDGRRVNEAGVQRVMALFLKHYGEPMPEEAVAGPPEAPAFVDDSAAIEVLCDEAALSDA